MAERVTKERPDQTPAAEVEPLPVVSNQSDEILEETGDFLDEVDALLAESISEQKETKPFTLADAIREGAKMGPQVYGEFGNQEGASCALGAAYLAAQARGLV
jgi:hypothetical protein